MSTNNISNQALQRMPMYLNYLRSLNTAFTPNISATTIAEGLELNQVQVRKDLASVSSGGKPKIGYVTNELIVDIENFLGCHEQVSAVIVGAGRLGCALLTYSGFGGYGLTITAAFDSDKSMTGKVIGGKVIHHTDELRNYCIRNDIHIGIITVPAEYAQSVCDSLVSAGVIAVWNFAPVHLSVSDDVLVHNENMAASLAVLSKHLSDRLHEENAVK